MRGRGSVHYPDILTPRQREVLELVRRGLTNEQIADMLGITLDGAKYHVSEIITKLGVSGRLEAAVWRPEGRRWWAAAVAFPLALLGWPLKQLSLPTLAKAGGAAVVAATGAGVGLLVWGVVVTEGPDASAVYADAGAEMAALTSYHSTIKFQFPDGRSSTIEIDMVPPDRFQVNWGHNASTIGIGDQFYIRQRYSQEWEEACASLRPARYCPEEEGMFGAYIAAFLPALATEMSAPTYLGTEVVGGVMTHHLQATLPLEILRLVEPSRTESEPVDLWVGVEDPLVHRYLFQFPEWTVTYTLSRFDEPVSIEAPANVRPAP